MPTICFLTSTRGDPHNDNATRLPAAWAAAGWSVCQADHDDIRLLGGRVCVADDQPIEQFDLIWLLGLGARVSFLDRMQLLLSVEPRRFVNTPHALLTQHAKYPLPLGPLAHHHPETYASRDPIWLRGIVERGGDWIAKPSAASFGRDVYRLNGDDPNLAVILNSLTGPDGSQYCLLQRYIAEIRHGETRVLLSAGDIIGAYKRRPGASHRANLAGDGTAETTELSADESALARAVAAQLQAHGVGFVAVDLAYPWIVEFNLANPGGLGTIERLTGKDLAPAVVAALASRFTASRRQPEPACRS
jgi:glutathione synthase